MNRIGLHILARRVPAAIVVAVTIGTVSLATGQIAPSRGEREDSTVYRRWEGTLSPLERALLDDAGDGSWQHFSLVAAALVAAGVDNSATLDRYQHKLDLLAESLKNEMGSDERAAGRPADVLRFMHRQILTGGYETNATDLRQALDAGRFNCVSASILFQWLASQVGLSATGLERPGHALSRVFVDGRQIDVETTCPDWFNRSPAAAVFGQQLTAARQSADPAPSREVGPVAIVAAVYYNRGIDLLSAGKYRQALAANAKALRLDPTNETVRGNLLAAINNWAIHLGRTGRYAEAARRLEEGMAIEPNYPLFRANAQRLHRQLSAQPQAPGPSQTAQSVELP